MDAKRYYRILVTEMETQLPGNPDVVIDHAVDVAIEERGAHPAKARVAATAAYNELAREGKL